jgi:hypothetical protein
MSMFALEKQPAKLVTFTPGKNFHGSDEKVAAGSIRLEVVCANDALDSFYPGLKAMLFRKRSSDEPAPTNGDLFPGELTARRMPHLQPIKWDEEFPGYELEISAGLEASEAVCITEAKLSKFVIEPMDGGSCRIGFSAAAEMDSPEDSGQLCWWIQDQVELTLTPPAADKRADTKTKDMFEPAADAPARKNVLVNAIEVDQNHSTHLFSAKCALSDGDAVKVGEWAYRPSLDEIAMKISDELDASVEFTTAVRTDYAPEDAEA